MGDPGLGRGEDPEGAGFCPACPPLKAAEERAWENQVAPAPGGDLDLTLTLRNKRLRRGKQQGHMNSPGVVRVRCIRWVPACPKCSLCPGGHHSPSPSPSRAPPAPLGDSVYLGSGPWRRQRPHPPSPASEQCLHTQPSRTEGLLETRPQQVEASRVSASSNPPKGTPPTPPAVPLQRSPPPSLRHVLAPDQHFPGLSYSHPTLRGSPPPAPPASRPAPCTSLHPGWESQARVHSETGLRGPETGLSARASWF